MKNLYAKWLLHLIHEMAAVTWVVGPDGYVVDVPEWMELTGQNIEDVRGDGWMDAIHPDDLERVRSAWMTAVTHGSHYNTDYRLRCADGVYRWFNARGVQIVDTSGAVQQWIGVILPIAGSNRFGRSVNATTLKTGYADISPAALRAARAMLGWSASEMAKRADVSLSTVRRLEDEGERDSTRSASLLKIIDALMHQPLKLHASDQGVIEGVSQTGTSSKHPAWQGLPSQQHLQ